MTQFSAQIAGYGIDLDGQRMAPDWLDAAIATWFQAGGTVTVMFQHRAAGRCIELWQDLAGWYGTVEIIDEEEQRKVDAGIYKGLGVEIKGVLIETGHDAPNGVIAGGQITAVSLVDEPMIYGPMTYGEPGTR